MKKKKNNSVFRLPVLMLKELDHRMYTNRLGRFRIYTSTHLTKCVHMSMRVILNLLVDRRSKWCNSPLPKIGAFYRADKQDSPHLTVKAAEMGVSSSTDSVAGPSGVERGQGRNVGCPWYSASGTWVLELGEAVTGVPLKLLL